MKMVGNGEIAKQAGNFYRLPEARKYANPAYLPCRRVRLQLLSPHYATFGGGSYQVK